jgi:cystathionine beta-lyase
MTGLTAALDQISLAELRRRGSLKWTYAGPEVLGAFVAEMDFGTAPAVQDALRDAMARYAYGYLTPAAASEMSAVVAAWLAGRGWAVDPARIKPLPDVIKGLEAAITLYSRPGSPIVLPTPAYMPFLTVPPALGRQIIQVPMVTDGGRYVLDIDGIGAAFRRGGHLLVLCNPCNPVGRVYTAGELLAVAEVVEANGGRVFADEIHAPLRYPGHAHIPYASVSPVTAAHTVTGVATSKGWNLPGLKFAQLLLSNDADAAVWAERGATFEHGASTPGAWATIAAYRDGGPWLDDVVAYLDRNRTLLAALLAEHLPQVRFLPPEGTYLAWLDCRALFAERGHPPAERAGRTAGWASPADFFLGAARVMLTDGAACGEGGGGHVRLNFATPRPVLAEAVHRMAAAAGSG